MSNQDFVLHATNREDKGKGASRRLRHQGLVPSVIYGGSNEPQSISIISKDFLKHLENEAFYSHIVTLDVDGEAQDVILKDLQRHPAKHLIMHADFLRVSKNQKLTTRVPLHFINEDSCVGVKTQGGIVSHTMTDIEVSCLPADLPEFIEVDIATLKLDDILHISDIVLPKGVESVALIHGEDHDLPVVSIHKPKGVSTDEAEAAADGSAE
ncbi:MAG: large subunit ribosomal protein L25 [Pseudohongiellaceae bacterium]|jgi:large subunit ribosomal protein L25